MIDPKTGKPWMEYPYAEDGMDLWHTYEDYFGAFLSRHYRNDAALLADSELQAWWTEAKVRQAGREQGYSEGLEIGRHAGLRGAKSSWWSEVRMKA